MTSHSIAMIFLPIMFVGVFYTTVVAGDSGGVELASTIAEQSEFDYFVFALQWAPTYCSRSTECCTHNACCRGADGPSVFTIRGLWPDYNDGSWPSCCSGPAFNETQISELHSVLDTYWPILSCELSSTCTKIKTVVWADEWELHGTCASPVTGDQYNYFMTTIDLYFKYNVTEVLFEAGYVPSNSEKYPSRGIIYEIENAFHTTPQITCLEGSLKDIRLCFTKDFKFRDCVEASNCPDYVNLPEINATRVATQSVFGHESF